MHKRPYIYEVEYGHMERDLKICHMSADSFFFQTEDLLFNFADGGGGTGHGRVTKLVIFCGRHKCMTPKWFKITTKAIIRGSSFFLNVKQPARNILTAYITTTLPIPPPAPPSSPLSLLSFGT